ncbi:MAG TPA: tRNA lysidine(34) synthetase TilS [Actinomycetota bacterium]|jgi:tRNA(Ile)-lysidine synthase|nr:tRNA lysidine(34) synthetase TilS [Actinomycetota bacterium]
MLEHNVEQALRALGVSDGDRIAVACSGGADSVALLHLLAHRGVHVLHVDHHLRAESSADATFVEGLARGLGLGCRVLHVYVRRGKGESLEAAAREARYSALEQARTDLGVDWIATAHTRDDQAETVLLRLLRGGSLAGIAPRRGPIVRPLLGFGRDELKDWLLARSIRWHEDPSNEDVALERNWVRKVLLPAMRDRRGGVAKVLARAADHARADAEALDEIVRALLGRVVVDEAGAFLPMPELDPLPLALRSRLVRTTLRRIGVDPTSTELEAVNALRVGRRARCGGVRVDRTPGGIVFAHDPLPVPDVLPLPASGTIESRAWGIRVRVGPAGAAPWVWRSPLTGEPAAIRSRRAGDRVSTAAGTRKVQDVLVDAKIPSSLRDLVPLVATGPDALAVVGLTSYPVASGTVVDAEPCSATWSRKVLWTRSSA